jgi:hypothetical protein
MNSWRIKTIFDNRSQRVLPSAGTGLGGTVVRSSRGPEKPVYFSQGETTRLLNVYGAPTSDNPELLEAIEYNKSYPMWISSPSNLGRSSAIAIGAAGSQAINAGLNANVTNDLANLHLFSKMTLAPGGTVISGSLTMTDYLIVDSVTNEIETFRLLVNGEEVTTSLSEDQGVYTITGSDISSGTFSLDTGAVNLEFVTEKESTDVVEVEYSVNLADTFYGLIALKGPADSDYLRVKLSGVEITGKDAFEMQVQIKNSKGAYVDTIDSPITFSLDPEHEDGYGENIYIENVFEDSDFFVSFLNDSLEFTSFADDTEYVVFAGGSRGGEFSSVELAVGYEYFKQIRKYPVDVFFDATQIEEASAIFLDLRTNYHKYSRFILPVPNMTVAEALAWTMPVSDRGISYYYGYFYLRNMYHSSKKLIGIPMGEVAKKHADIMLLAFGGLAPAWYDENGMGGQLTGGRVIEALYDPDEAQLQLLDEARINPIVYDSASGPMIVSRRTSVSGSLSDYSFIDYSGAMDYILKNITSQVLPYQIVKLNDTSHRNIVRSKTNSIIQPMTVAPVNVVREYAIRCDGQNNNDEVLAREEFRLEVAVKFTPKSRTIILTFINTPQGSSVEEMFV